MHCLSNTHEVPGTKFPGRSTRLASRAAVRVYTRQTNTTEY